MATSSWGAGPATAAGARGGTGDGRLTRRRLVGIGGGGALVPLAAACGTAAGGPGGSAGSAPRSALPPAKIAFFTNWGAQHQATGQQRTLDAFQQQHPGVTVEMTTGAAGAEKIISAITAGAAPDLVSQNPQLLIPLAMKSTWRPLEDLLKTSPVVRREHYADAQFKLLSWKGKLYGIPAFEHFGGYALSLNAAHYQEVGLDPARPPATPDELLKAHERLTREEGGGLARLGLDPRDAAGGSYGFWAYEWGAPWWDPDALKLQLNHPTAVEANEFVASFYRQGRGPQIAEFRKQYAMWTAATSGIVVGTQSMQLTGYYQPGELRALPEKPARMGYTWWPNPKREKVYLAQGWSGAIPAESKQVDPAWRLLEFFTSTAAGQIMFDTIGWLNGSRQFLKEGKFDAVPDLKFFLEMPAKADRTAGNYVTPIQGEIDSEYGKGMTAVIAGQTGVKAMLDDLQARMQLRLGEVLR
jgi:ABC-type glycerol-3-phosphate transport system substrate-binding protein